MTYPYLPEAWLDRACTDLGFEDEHTIVIARVVELHHEGHLSLVEAETLCRATYFKAIGAYHMVED